MTKKLKSLSLKEWHDKISKILDAKGIRAEVDKIYEKGVKCPIK